MTATISQHAHERGHVGARGLQVGMTVFIYLLCMLPCMQDPNGAYIARWVPELAALPKKWLHQPWLAPADVLAHAGVKIGDGPGCYPAPHHHRRSAGAHHLLSARPSDAHFLPAFCGLMRQEGSQHAVAVTCSA